MPAAQTETMPQRRFNIESPDKETRKRSGSSALRQKQHVPQSDYKLAQSYNFTRSTAPTAAGLGELLRQIEELQSERDHFQNEAYAEKMKNSELEKEFHVLRNLIAQAQRPIGAEENLILKN